MGSGRRAQLYRFGDCLVGVLSFFFGFSFWAARVAAGCVLLPGSSQSSYCPGAL